MKTEKQRIRKELAARIRESRAWLIAAKKASRLVPCIASINRFEGEINAFRVASKITGK